jgi:hypothetical protein
MLIKFVPGERLKVKLIANSGFFRGFVIRAENAKVKDGMGKLWLKVQWINLIFLESCFWGINIGFIKPM